MAFAMALTLVVGGMLVTSKPITVEAYNDTIDAQIREDIADYYNGDVIVCYFGVAASGLGVFEGTNLLLFSDEDSVAIEYITMAEYEEGNYKGYTYYYPENRNVEEYAALKAAKIELLTVSDPTYRPELIWAARTEIIETAQTQYNNLLSSITKLSIETLRLSMFLKAPEGVVIPTWQPTTVEEK